MVAQGRFKLSALPSGPSGSGLERVGLTLG